VVEYARDEGFLTKEDIMDKTITITVETWNKITEEKQRYKDALERLLGRYVSMVNSGDCGNWDPETEEEVIEARAALKGD